MRDSIVDGIGKSANNQFNGMLMDHDYEDKLDLFLEKLARKIKTKSKNEEIIEKRDPIYEESGDDQTSTEIEVQVIKPKVVPHTESSTKPMHAEQVSLQSAIVLSEILGPPKCKNRRRRMGRGL